MDTQPEKVAITRVGHSRAGVLALGAITLAWILTPILALFSARYNAESQSSKDVPHTVPLSVIDTLGRSIGVLAAVSLASGIVGFLQGKRKQSSAKLALAMLFGWIGLVAILS